MRNWGIPSQQANPFLLIDKEQLIPYERKQIFALPTLFDYMKSSVLGEQTNRTWSLLSSYLPNTTRHPIFYLLFWLLQTSKSGKKNVVAKTFSNSYCLQSDYYINLFTV